MNRRLFKVEAKNVWSEGDLTKHFSRLAEAQEYAHKVAGWHGNPYKITAVEVDIDGPLPYRGAIKV